MSIKSFKEFMSEMAYRNFIPKNSTQTDLSKLWNNEYVKHSDKKLISNNIDNKYRIYRIGGAFFLTNLQDEYEGAISYLNDGNVLTIDETFSKISGGFYSIMFENILNHTEFKEILSSESLSDGAINSYNKLYNSNKFNIRIKDEDGNYSTYSNKALLEDDYHRVSVKLV